MKKILAVPPEASQVRVQLYAGFSLYRPQALEEPKKITDGSISSTGKVGIKIQVVQKNKMGGKSSNE